MQFCQFLISATILAQGIRISSTQAAPSAFQPWAFVQFSTFQGSAALIANPHLTQSALHTVSQAPGYVRGYQGRQYENPNIFHLAFEWTSIAAQKEFESSPKGHQVAAVLKTATASRNLPSWIHLPFIGDYRIGFEAPVIEVVVAALRDDKTPDQLFDHIANVYALGLNSAPGIHIPATRAEIVEQPRVYYFIGGWDHVSDHIAAVSVEPAASLVAASALLVKPEPFSGITHVVFTKIV